MALMCLVIAATMIMQTWPLWRKPLIGLGAGLTALIGTAILTYAATNFWNEYKAAKAQTEVLRERFRLDLRPQSSELKPYQAPAVLEPYK